MGGVTIYIFIYVYVYVCYICLCVCVFTYVVYDCEDCEAYAICSDTVFYISRFHELPWQELKKCARPKVVTAAMEPSLNGCCCAFCDAISREPG